MMKKLILMSSKTLKLRLKKMNGGVNQVVKKKSLKECLHGQMIFSKVDHQRSKVKN